MSKAQVIYWDASAGNEGIIASAQTALANGYLQLNSNLPSVPSPTGLSINANNQTSLSNYGSMSSGFSLYPNIRRLSVTASGNLSAVNMTITGYGSPIDVTGNPTGPLNQLLTETHALPNATTNYLWSTNIYNRILSAQVSATTGASTVSLGYGTSGVTEYIFPDDDRFGWYATASGQVFNSGTGTLTYTCYVSLNKPYTPGSQGNILPFIGTQIPTYAKNIPAFTLNNMFTPAANNNLETATANQICLIPSPIATLWFNVTDGTPANHGSAIFTFLQQGVR